MSNVVGFWWSCSLEQTSDGSQSSCTLPSWWFVWAFGVCILGSVQSDYNLPVCILVFMFQQSFLQKALCVGLSRDHCYTRFSTFQKRCCFNWVNLRKYVVKLLKLTVRWQLNMAAWIMTSTVKPHIAAGLFQESRRHPRFCSNKQKETHKLRQRSWMTSDCTYSALHKPLSLWPTNRNTKKQRTNMQMIQRD